MRKLTTGMAAALVAVMATAGCGEPGAGSGAGTFDDEVTGVSLSLTTVPVDAKCYRATFTSGATSVVKTATPTAGSTTPVLFTGGLTSSTTYALTLEVFDLACPSVVATTPITWTGSASGVLVIGGTLTPVTIVLRRPAGTAVTVDYDSSIVLSQGSGANAYDLAVFDSWVYVARGSFVERIPVTGGGVEVVATGSNITEVAADATGYYFSDSGNGLYWVPPGQSKRMLVSRAPYTLFPTPTGLLTVWASTSGNGTIERFTTAGGLTTIASGLWAAHRAVSDGNATAIWYGSATSGAATTITKAPLAGGAPTVLYSAPTGTALADIAADATHVYFAQTALPGTTNGIFRVPLAGGAATAVASSPTGSPSRVLVDATNVYFVSRLTDAQGACMTSSISKVPKAGGAITTLWSRSGSCPYAFTQSATQLFFEQGIDVRRIDK